LPPTLLPLADAVLLDLRGEPKSETLTIRLTKRQLIALRNTAAAIGAETSTVTRVLIDEGFAQRGIRPQL
jgi:predicted DNA binding CopG/RHH family protein